MDRKNKVCGCGRAIEPEQEHTVWGPAGEENLCPVCLIDHEEMLEELREAIREGRISLE